MACLHLGLMGKAQEELMSALLVDPTSLEACQALCNLLMQQKQYQEAQKILLNMLRHHAMQPWLHYALGNCDLEQANFEQAITHFKTAIRIDPVFGDAHYNCGNAYKALGDAAQALLCFQKAFDCNPKDVEACINQGVCLVSMKKHGEALSCFERALELDPNNVGAMNNLGGALNELGRHHEALVHIGKAIEIQPRYAPAHFNLGNIHLAKQKPLLAKQCFETCVHMAPNEPSHHHNLGIAFRALGEAEQALRCYENALQLNPQYVDAHYNKGNAMMDLKRYPEAVQAYRTAVDMHGAYDFLAGTICHADMHMCLWTQWQTQVFEILNSVRRGEAACAPFALLALTDDGELQLKAAKIWREKYIPESEPGTILRPVRADKKIRIGYFSADFWAHATAHLMVEMIELHDKSAFEILAFSYGSQNADTMRSRLERGFDEFIDAHALTNEELVELARSKQLDIAIDLKGYTLNSRLGIFAKRVAPLQISYLGYPGTLADPSMDYLVADPQIVPREYVGFYAEKILWMPDTYQVNQKFNPLPEPSPDREQFGLPRDLFVFAAFNNNYKITPIWFDVWMRILRRVPNSVLWVLEDNEWVKNNLLNETRRRGVDAHRIHFAPRLPREQHLQRQRCADLFLDTFPCNAHTTASDALRYGLPLLTCRGEGFASRVAYSLLCAVGLPELATDSAQGYENMAVDLASNDEKLKAIKMKLSDALMNSKLFDTQNFVQNFELALKDLHSKKSTLSPMTHWTSPVVSH